MNFWITGKPDELKKTLKRVDILSINEGKTYLLSGTRNIVKAAEMIRAMGPSVLVIKRGEYGASLFVGNEVFMAPAFPTGNVVDPTGAGDSFAGAMMGTLAAHGVTSTSGKAWTHALRQSIVNGCVMASFTIEDFSLNRILKLKTQELKSRQKKFADMIKVR
jgi:sugar/nucleoside kinase (ribokinase family)